MSTNSTSESRELVETPDLNGSYPRLDEAGIAALARSGRDVRRSAGQAAGAMAIRLAFERTRPG